AYNQNLNWSDPANSVATQTRLKVLECPATPNPDRLDGAPETNWVPIVATGDYAGIYGVDPRLVAQGLAERVGDGVLSKTTPVRILDVTDGTSNTLFVTESAGRPNVYRGRTQVGTAPGTRV